MTHDELKHIITNALAEDIGQGDITSELLIPMHIQGEMAFVARERLVVAGAFIAQAVYGQLDAAVNVEVAADEGRAVEPGAVLAIARGPARALLTAERVALNLMQRACGVATLTARYVETVRGTNAIILDTRKTMPGLRALDKYAVRMGGGRNHRMRLDDMVLIKDNHLAVGIGAVGIGDWGLGIGEAVRRARAKLSSPIPNPQSPIPIEVECDTLMQVEEAVAAMPDRIMLDNMDLDTMRQAVRLVAGRVKLEASGGVSLAGVRAIAETGVDYISVGKLTHSAPAADIGADILLDP